MFDAQEINLGESGGSGVDWMTASSIAGSNGRLKDCWVVIYDLDCSDRE